MTSLTRLTSGVLLLTAAVFTAKFLHQAEEPLAKVQPVQTEIKSKLRWQARAEQPVIEPTPIQEAESLIVRDLAIVPQLTRPANSTRQVSIHAENASQQDEPTARIGDVQFARLAELTQSDSLDRENPTIAEPEVPHRLAELTRANTSGSTPPFPFARSYGANNLVAVDEEDRPPQLEPDRVSHYTVQFGDTLPHIAQQLLGNNEEYMLLYEANLDVLTSPADVQPGTVLKIPLR